MRTDYDSWLERPYQQQCEEAEDYASLADAAREDIWASAELGEALCEAIADASSAEITRLVTALRTGNHHDIGAELLALVEERVEQWADMRAIAERDRLRDDAEAAEQEYNEMRWGR